MLAVLAVASPWAQAQADAVQSRRIERAAGADPFKLAQDAVAALRSAQRPAADGSSSAGELRAVAPLSPQQRASYTTQLKSHLQAARQGQSATRAQLDTTGRDLHAKKVANVILERQQLALAQFEQRAREFDRVSNAWLANPGDAELRALDEFFERNRGGGGGASARPAAAFDNKRLPWGSPKPTTRQPAVSKSAWYQQLWGQQRVHSAQAGNVGPITFQVPPEPGQAPSEADLAPTPEAPRSAAIVAKAADLGKNPVAIHNWVRNHVEWVPTWGALQNADETLTKLRGNAHDIASLEIALLRASDIPARYQYGTIEVGAEALRNGVGGAASAEAAQQLLGQGGIASRGISEAGRITKVQMEHVWVSAFVNWAPSRGARQGSAAQHVNPVGPYNAWTALDASTQRYDDTAGAGLVDALAINARGVIDTAKQAALCTPESAARLDAASLQAAFASAQTRLDAAAAAAGSDTTIAQLLGTHSLVASAPSMLGGALPYAVVSDVATTVAVPEGMKWRLRWSLFGSDADAATGATAAQLSSDWQALAGKRVSLSFAPATPADASLIASYLPAAHADASPVLAGEWPAGLPGYLIRVKAELRVEGQLVASGGSFVLGSDLPATLAVFDAGTQAWSQSAQDIRAGETHVLVPDAHGLGAAELQQAKTRWADVLATLSAATAKEVLAGEALRQVALGYLATVDANARVLQRAAGVVQWRLPSLARAFTPASASVTYGIVTQVAFPGIALAVDRLHSAVAARRDGADTLAHQRQDMMRSAAHGHLVLERLLADGAATHPAASAIKVIAVAAALADNPVLQLDAGNATTLAAQLQTDALARETLTQAALGGATVRVPRNIVSIGGWSGHAAALDDGQGAGAYLMLDGGRSHLAVQHGAGGIGWLALAAPLQRPQAVHWLGATVPKLHDAAIDVLAPGSDGNRFAGLPMRSEIANGALLSRLVAAAGSAPCEALVAIVAAGLNASTGLGADGNALAAAPVFDSTPPSAGVQGQAYQYAPSVRDPQGLPVTLRLDSGPSGMALGAERTLRWASPALGTHAIVIRADNGRAAAEQRWELVVTSGAQPLELGLALSPSVADAGQSVSLTAFSNGGRGAVTLSATLNGQPLSLNAGAADITAGPSGTYRIAVRASDAQETLERQAVFTVRDAGDTTAPVALIATPPADAEITTPIDVTGTASDANLAYWQLLLRPAGAGDANWKEIARGASNVANGLLGKLDPRSLSNGAYELGLRVLDINGQSTSTTTPIEIARDLKLGQFRLGFTDIRAELQGLPLVLTRTYDSTQRNVQGDFGWGWRASSQDASVRKNMVLGLNWQVQARQLELCLAPAGQRRITISLPDGGLYRFKAKNRSECGFAQIPPLDIVFDALPLPVGGGSGQGSAVAQLEAVNIPPLQAQGGVLFDMDALDVWNPRDFKLTTAEGAIYHLREGVGILRVTDVYGNSVDYGPNGYQHSAGLGLQLTRDAQGRITRATDPAGKSLVYTYNAQGELDSVTDRSGKTTRFGYARSLRAGDAGSVIEPHLLSSITDADGKVIASQEFDEYGRLIASRDANGQQSTVVFDEAANTQRVTDRRGNTTSYSFDAAGNITRIVDAKGNVTELSYDANGNELTRSLHNRIGNTTRIETVGKTFDTTTGAQTSETNPLEQTTSTTYSSGTFTHQRLNPKTITDAKGNVTSYDYLFGQEQSPGAVPSSITEPLGRSTAIAIDSKGNLRNLNVAGIASAYDYDDQGRRIKETDGTGAVTTYTFDANGNELTRTVTRSVGATTRTETTTSVYDADNRLVQQTDPTGAITRTTYNAAGKPVTQTDALGRITRYSYDANARPMRTEHPDGTAESTEYDANGNETARTDRQGRTTRMTYDELDRLVQTTHPDGTSTRTEYDSAGRVLATIDANNQRTSNEYDAAGRMTAMVDASGRRTEYEYDANGNRTKVTIAAGTAQARSTVTTYDALNRATRIEQPDGSAHSVVFRADGRKASETDARGVTSSYGYDATGRLVSVTQSGVAQATTYAYDQTGAKTTQTDAKSHKVTWSFDAAGRPTSRTLPDGQTESFEYDLQGQLTARTTFGGQRIAFSYDSAGRQTSQIIAATATTPARAAQFTYNADGQRAAHVETGANSANGQTSYSYDAQGRLIQMVAPQGTLGWAYDNAGRITERSTAEGTTRYQYDGDGRLQKLIAPDGKTTSYVYDAAGRNTRSEQQLSGSDKLVTERRYDSADRQIAIAHSKQTTSGTTLIAGQAIVRGQGGAVSRIDTFDNSASFDAATGAFSGNPTRVQAFGYDANARLQSEKEYKGAEIAALQANANAPATQATTYGYDAVGNRISKTVTTSAGTETTTYAYDINDRLTSETLSTATGSTVTTTYTWDSNGNLASKTTPGEYTAYVFDADNRLVEVKRGASASTANTIAKYGYDADGQRVRKETASGITNYLIDPTTTWPQVVLETKGTQRTAYTWGHELRQQAKGAPGSANSAPTEALIPLHGHLGTTIAAVDKNGNAVERYEASAFGELRSESPKTNHLYTGEYWESEVKLTYLRARWYGPANGRFLGIDPAEADLEAPRSSHPYSYASVDPVGHADPAGEMSLGETGVAQNVQGVLSTAAQASIRHQVRNFLIGSPRKGDFGLVGELVFQAMGEALDDALRSQPRGTSPARIGDAAHRKLETKVAQLNAWLRGLPLARDVTVRAELFLFPSGSEVRGRGRPSGSIGLDVAIEYRGRRWVAFDMKTGRTDMSSTRRLQYQRRFGTRVFSVGVELLP